MSSVANLRSRRSAAQRHALAGVEREIRAQDAHGHRKYLREFNQAFRSYESVLNSDELQNAWHAADIILIGDYHALPAAQRYAASLIEQRALAANRPVVLAVEAVFARHQPVLEEWWRREIDENELRQRIRFDLDWGYNWTPFYELLVAARDHGEAVYGIDCSPRGGFSHTRAHDRHAAERIAAIRERHPDALIIVLFGESHLAPGHLPGILKQRLAAERTLVVLQNVDALYWQLAGESSPQVPAVQVKDGVICVFNATPLEKYEGYRLCLERWGEAEAGPPDLTPSVYNLIEGLAGFLEINCYSPHNGTQPTFLVDKLPEVYSYPSEAAGHRLQSGVEDPDSHKELIGRIEECGGAYLARTNTFFIREFQLPHAAREVARFLHHACRGLPSYRAANDNSGLSAEDALYGKALEVALGALAERALCPFQSQPPAAEAELNSDSLGIALGDSLYRAYVRGTVKTAYLRRLFLASLRESGAACKLYQEAARKAGFSTPSSPLAARRRCVKLR